MTTKSNIIVALAIIAVGSVSFISGRWSAASVSGNVGNHADTGRELTVQAGGKGSENASDGALNGAMVDASSAISVGASSTSSEAGQNQFVASKNGQKYFPIACGSAKTIKKENAIYFKTAAEAELSGRTQSSQCKY